MCLLKATQSEKLMAYAKYSYDALGKRIRLSEFGSYENKTFHLDVLLLFRQVMTTCHRYLNCVQHKLLYNAMAVLQGVMYKINWKNQTCCKKPLNADFHPLEIPRNASLLGQVVLGGSSGPGQGVLVNSWGGELQMKKGPGTERGN